MGDFPLRANSLTENMQLTIKTLKQEQLSVEVDPSCKISEVKQKINEKYSRDPEAQRLIFAGKILEDSQTVESYNITEKEFLVLMVRKIAAKKPEPKPAEPASSDSNVDMVTGDEYEAMIERIAEMGFERSQIMAALQASFNNPNRAIEYLMNGLPDDIPAQPSAPAANPSNPQPSSPASANPNPSAPIPGNLFQQA